MPQRLKVLLSAYACEPNKGSEPEVGWQWALQMARFHDVTVLTRTNNRESIEAGLRALPPGQPVPRFVYHDEGGIVLRLKKMFHATKVYYVFWQRSAQAVVADLVKRERFDLLHHVTFAGYRYRTAIWNQGVPCIWGPIGGMESIPWRLLPWRYPSSWIIETMRNTNNIIQATPFHVLPVRAKFSTAILVSTPETQRAFASLGIEAELMPTIGLHFDEVAPVRRETPRGPLRLLFVGQIILLKGVDLILHALKESQSMAHVTFVGDGSFLEDAKKLAHRLGLDSQVHFAGRLPREKTLDVYRGHDVFIFPSLHDSGGFAVLEAMANGLPVICLDCGGPAISVGDGCGIRVPLLSRHEVIAALADAVHFYDSKREAVREHGESAKSFAAANYDWNRKGEKMAEIYDRACAEASALAGAARGAISSQSGRLLLTPASRKAGLMAALRQYAFSANGLVITLILFVLFGTAQVTVLQVLKKRMVSIVHDTLPGLSYAGEANAILSQSIYRLRLCAESTDPSEQHRYRAEIEALAQKTIGNWNNYEHAIFEAEDRRLFNDLINKRNRYYEIRSQTFAIVEAQRQPDAIRHYKSVAMPAYQEYKNAADALFEYNVKQGQQRGESAIVLARVTQIAMVLLGFALFASGFLLGFFK